MPGLPSGCARDSLFQRVWARGCAESSLYSLQPEFPSQALPALLREGAVLCKAMALNFPAGLEGWETRESKTAVEKGEKAIQIMHIFLILAIFLFRKEFICYRSE